MPNAKDYAKIADFLENLDIEELTLTFKEIEDIIGDQLPDTAYTRNQWWENNEYRHSQAKHGWLAVDWNTFDISLKSKKASFRKIS